MSDLNDACTALATAASAVTGLRGKAYVDDNINAPEAQVFNRAFDPRLVMDGSAVRTVALGVRVFVNRLDLRSAQVAPRGFMEQSGATSVLGALEGSDNYSAGVNFVVVTQIGQPFETTTESGTYLAVDFDVEITL